MNKQNVGIIINMTANIIRQFQTHGLLALRVRYLTQKYSSLTFGERLASRHTRGDIDLRFLATQELETEKAGQMRH